ncbi:hypothetical protein OHS33_00985 [Streptomyces sp. NBC_00536]|uniref:hypothetical protein n=1 Tax=Streptomyces sp. NBC_00536 TaxID=2975769 RepID=UPI002E8224D0|nr:hypothetical protein [Streptomyces sp. NBC_00536]WUC77045.1 hypothetical protein OHS33_00985 [Streptomyces sp. NBC_00536]
MAGRTWRTWRTCRALVASLAVLIGLTAAATSPAFAGLNGPVAAYLDQHCGTDTIGSGTTTIAVPVDRVTLNLEAVGHDPANSKITAVYTIPGTSRYGTLFGQFDPARGNVTFNYTVGSPPPGATLSLSYEVVWTDGTYYNNTLTQALLHCTPDSTGAAVRWNDHTYTTVFQQCTSVNLGSGTRPLWVRAEDVTVHLSHDAVDTAAFAGRPVWADYWIPGHKAYTSGVSATADSTGETWLTFRMIAPPTGAELDILSSVRDSSTRTYPGHTWVTISC